MACAYGCFSNAQDSRFSHFGIQISPELANSMYECRQYHRTYAAPPKALNHRYKFDFSIKGIENNKCIIESGIGEPYQDVKTFSKDRYELPLDISKGLGETYKMILYNYDSAYKRAENYYRCFFIDESPQEINDYINSATHNRQYKEQLIINYLSKMQQWHLKDKNGSSILRCNFR